MSGRLGEIAERNNVTDDKLDALTERVTSAVAAEQTAMELGYGSTSAFVYAFRTEMGCGPQAYMRGRVAHPGTHAPSTADGSEHLASA